MILGILKSILYILLSAGVIWITGFILNDVTHFMMGLGWIWIILLFVLFSGITAAIIGFVPKLLSRFIQGMRSHYLIEYIIVGACLLIYAFYSIYSAWTYYDVSYSFKQIVVAILQNILVIGIFSGLWKTLIKGR